MPGHPGTHAVGPSATFATIEMLLFCHESIASTTPCAVFRDSPGDRRRDARWRRLASSIIFDLITVGVSLDDERDRQFVG